jgi:hypothetical protein
MQILNKTPLWLFIVMSVIALAGCEKEGPAEQAGEQIDETMESIQQDAEDAGEMVQEKVEEAGDQVEEATDQATQ